MHSRFDQEFYRSEWQRTLPLGPHGIQPYVRTSPTSRLPDPGRLVARLSAMAQGAIAFGRWTAIGLARGQLPLAHQPRTARQYRSLRLAHETARPVRDERRQRAACPGRPSAQKWGAERTETIEHPGRHHCETHGDYVRVNTSQQWCESLIWSERDGSD